MPELQPITAKKILMATWAGMILVARLHWNEWIGVTIMLTGIAALSVCGLRFLLRRYRPQTVNSPPLPAFALPEDSGYRLTVKRNGETVTDTRLRGPARVTVRSDRILVSDRDGERSY